MTRRDLMAYRLGLDALNWARQQVLFVAYTGWDAAGANAFGYPTFRTNRLKLPPEELGETADGVGSSLADTGREFVYVESNNPEPGRNAVLAFRRNLPVAAGCLAAVN